MFLVKSSFMLVVKKQYAFKLHAWSKFFLAITFTQIIGMLFALTDAGGNVAASNVIYKFNIERNSTIQVFIFTLVCIIGGTILSNTKEYKDMDFTFVSNRISSNVSNIGFLITLSLFGAVTSALSGVLVRTIKYLFIGGSKIIESGFFLTPGEILCSIGAGFLYILLISSIVYFCSVLTENSKIFIIVILAVLVLLPQTPFFADIIEFYGKEGNLLIFMIKAIITAAIFFSTSIFASNKLEVRR